MRFRNRSKTPPPADVAAEAAAPARSVGPYDFDDRPPAFGEEFLDLGSLVLAPVEGFDLHIQVDEASGVPAALLLANPEGALELRAFAAPRGGGMWDEILPALQEDVIANGGSFTEGDGPWGPEVHAAFIVQTEDGQTGTQNSRMIGVEGPRWLLRATFLGQPAVSPANADGWHGLLDRVAVRRGAQALPKGQILPITLPANAKPMQA